MEILCAVCEFDEVFLCLLKIKWDQSQKTMLARNIWSIFQLHFVKC